MHLENVYSQISAHNESTNKATKLISIILLLLAFSIPLSTTATNIFLMIFLLLWLIEGDFNRKVTYIWRYKACFASILVLVGLIFGCSYSTANWTDILLYLKKISKLIYLPFLISYFDNPRQRKWTINCLIISGIITAVIGIIYNQPKIFKNTIDTSLIILTTTFLLMHQFDLKNKLYVNFGIILASLINIFYLFYISLGRTSQLIFLLLIPLFLSQKINLSKKISTFIILLITMITILVIGYCALFSTQLHKNWSNVIHQYNNYKSNPTNYEQNSISQRLVYYKNTLNLIKEKPLLGWGTGTFSSVYKDFIIKNNLFTKNQQTYLYPTNPHNEYLLFGMQLGICGVSLLIWFFYVIFKSSFLISTPEKYILQGTIITLAIGCLFNSWLMDFTGNLFIILIAICLGALPNVRVDRNN